MSEDFKYLGNNSGTQNVPFLDNVNVQKTVTNFNYSLWGASTKIYLKHVPASWSSDYQNVVQFESKSDRDAYFKTNPPITLETEFRIGHDGIIRLPIPYDNLIDYNYLVAEYPDAPVPGYQSNIARKQYFYFIKDCKYISPNTTEVELELDVWTTYIDEIEINNMQLERGHYAMTLTDVDEYLSDPLNNNIGLLAPDVNFDVVSKIASADFYSYNVSPYEGNNYIGIVTTAAIYEDSWYDRVPTANNNNNYHPISNNCNNFNVFFINALDFPTFCFQVQENLPQFFQTIQAIFKVNEYFINIYPETFKLPGVDVVCYNNISPVVNKGHTLLLNKSLFNYPKEYENLAKLYTFPYATLEITNNASRESKEFKVESISGNSVDIYSQSSFNYPFLGVRSFIQNINSNYVNYDYGGNVLSDWQEYCFDDEFPRYGIFQNGHKKYMMETKYLRIQQQNDIDTSYNNANRSNETSKTNADDSASTSKVNADESAITESNISKRNNDQEKDFVTHDMDNSVEVNEINILNNKKISYNNILATKNSANLNIATEYAAQLTKAWSNNTAIMNQAINGMTSGNLSLPGVAAIGQTMINANYATNSAANLYHFQTGVIGQSALFNMNLQATINGLHETFTGNISSDQPDIDTNGWLPGGEISGGLTTDINIPPKEGLINTNSRNILNKVNENIEYKRDQSYNVSEQNRIDSLDQSLANNNRSYNQAIANNERLYEANAANNLAIKNNAEAAIQNAINQSELSNNVIYGDFTNDIIDAQKKRGLVIKVKKQSDDAIKRTGDYFLRYGYAFEGNCDFTGFNIMKYFTYWKVKEVWLFSDKVNNNIINTFKSILQNGVTVWRDPQTMCNVSIYDNMIGGE